MKIFASFFQSSMLYQCPHCRLNELKLQKTNVFLLLKLNIFAFFLLCEIKFLFFNISRYKFNKNLITFSLFISQHICPEYLKINFLSFQLEGKFLQFVETFNLFRNCNNFPSKQLQPIMTLDLNQNINSIKTLLKNIELNKLQKDLFQYNLQIFI